MEPLATITAAELDRQVGVIRDLVAAKLKKSKTTATSRELTTADIEATVLVAAAADALEREHGRPFINITAVGAVIAEEGPVITILRGALNYGFAPSEVIWPEVIRGKTAIPGKDRLIGTTAWFPSDRDRLIPVVRAWPWYRSEYSHRTGAITMVLDGELLASLVTIEGALAPTLDAEAASGLAPTLSRPA